MIYWKPILRLLDKPLDSGCFIEQFGGMPWGLPQERWPMCEQCDAPMALLVQLMHHPKRLNLGKTGRVVYVFMCNHPDYSCSTWEPGGGANSVIILNGEDLQPGMTSPPPHSGVNLLPTLQVLNWRPYDDKIPEELASKFFDWDTYDSLGELADQAEMTTRLGSVPSWIQTPVHFDGYQFVGQIDYCLNLLEPSDLQNIITKIGPNGEKYYKFVVSENNGYTLRPLGQNSDDWAIEFANFGDCGMGYLFIHPDPVSPSGLFYWECF